MFFIDEFDKIRYSYLLLLPSCTPSNEDSEVVSGFPLDGVWSDRSK